MGRIARELLPHFAPSRSPPCDILISCVAFGCRGQITRGQAPVLSRPLADADLAGKLRPKASPSSPALSWATPWSRLLLDGPCLRLGRQGRSAVRRGRIDPLPLE